MIHMGIPADEAVLAAVGKIALRHGQLDYHLKMTVRVLADLTIEQGIDATARQTSRDLRERIRKLAVKRFGEGRALCLLDAILSRCRAATEKRNRLLHSLWAHELDGDPVIRDQGYEFAAIPSAAELEAVASELEHIARELLTARTEGFLHDALNDSAK